MISNFNKYFNNFLDSTQQQLFKHFKLRSKFSVGKVQNKYLFILIIIIQAVGLKVRQSNQVIKPT